MAFQVRDNRGGNWFWMHNVIYDAHGAELGAYGLAIYGCLCRHITNDSQQTWISVRVIQDQTGISERKVREELKRLQALGLLHAQERTDENGRLSNIYTLLNPMGNISAANPGAPGAPAPARAAPAPARGAGVPASTAPPPCTTDRPLQFMNKTELPRLNDQDDLSKAIPTQNNIEGERTAATTSSTPRTAGKRQLRHDVVAPKATEQEFPTPRAPRGRPPKPTPYIERVMTELSVQLHDEEHAKANITQAMRLFRAGGRSEQEFIEEVYSARDIARARGDIRKAAKGDAALRNRAPYFFRVLEDLLSRPAPAAADELVDEVAPAGRRGWSPEDAERFTTGRYGRLFQS